MSDMQPEILSSSYMCYIQEDTAVFSPWLIKHSATIRLAKEVRIQTWRASEKGQEPCA